MGSHIAAISRRCRELDRRHRVVIGVGLVIMGWKSSIRTTGARKRAGTLVTEGIYKFIRHPQYTGFSSSPLA